MKKLILPLLSILLLTACKKEITKEKIFEEKGIVTAAKDSIDNSKNSLTAAKSPPEKIDVCHYDAVTNSWHTINISMNAWPDHQSHGDVRLDDQDEDGYVLNNECGVAPMGDCDDLNAAINSGATETCNGIDDDCDGQVDEGVKTTYYQDNDADTYGNPSVTTQACSPTEGFVTDNTDCSDNNAAINPGVTEICNNGIDDNCNGQVDENCFVIGAFYQGGKIAYILQPGDPVYVANETHGLIAAASDQGNPPWGCSGTTIPGANGTAIGTGNQNTIDIMAGCATAGIAARLCGDLVLNGYSDWYLPSNNELNKLYINRVAIGGFASGYFYWSSTQYNNSIAYHQRFSDGYFNYTYKFNTG